MLIQLNKILTEAQLNMVNDLLEKSQFTVGERSAGKLAGKEKDNLEIKNADQTKSSLDNLVMNALLQHPVYLNAGLPKKIAAPIFARYTKGMRYGKHIDNPIMGVGDVYRSDVAITIFLNDPDEYDGGELVIEAPLIDRKIKFPAGDGVMYPASYQHQICEVTRGERRVAVTWMQSLVAEAEKRALLYQLYLAKEDLIGKSVDDKSTILVDQTYCNLLRMWSET